MRFIYDDGGRLIAGYKGSAGDCFVRATAIASGKTYQEIYDGINKIAERERTGKRKRKISNARTGVYRRSAHKYLESIGFHWVPCMKIGSGCKVHVREDELPKGRLILNLSRHFAAFIDGVLHDTYDSSRDGTRCVYGYWILKDVIR